VNDPFLKETGVETEEAAMQDSIVSALQRNKTYANGVPEGDRKSFREEWAKLIRSESQRYSKALRDDQHCEAIERISNNLSCRFEPYLHEGHLRFGTSQKAFNLYLKFLWRLKMMAVCSPPHCPVDRIVLTEAGIKEAWTKCDSRDQYMRWIRELRKKAHPDCLAQWEYRVWLKRRKKPT